MIESLVAGWTFRTTPEATPKICLKGSCCRCITADLNAGHVALALVTQAAGPGSCCHHCWSHGARDWGDVRASAVATAEVSQYPCHCAASIATPRSPSKPSDAFIEWTPHHMQKPSLQRHLGNVDFRFPASGVHWSLTEWADWQNLLF